MTSNSLTTLRCSNLTFAYNDTPVLRGISLELHQGQVVALLGPNGSGKSTLIRCLLGQLPATGDILLNEKPLHDWRGRDIARQLAYLAQAVSADPIHRVIDILRMGRAPYLQAFGLESARDAKVVTEVATLLSLKPLLNRRLDELSGGQRQRVFLGRCLVQEPSVLLLDEPSTFLDLKHQVEMGQLLRDLARKKNLAILMASHDLNLAGEFADRMILLSEGTIVGDGSPNEVLNAELLSRVYGLPMKQVMLDDGRSHVFPIVGGQ